MTDGDSTNRLQRVPMMVPPHRVAPDERDGRRHMCGLHVGLDDGHQGARAVPTDQGDAGDGDL